MSGHEFTVLIEFSKSRMAIISQLALHAKQFFTQFFTLREFVVSFRRSIW